MPTINRASPELATQQIAGYYRQRIAAGVLGPGARLPSSREMAHEWGVSQVTVRAALDLLRSEGLIRSRQGQGVFVRPAMSRARRDAANYQRSKDLVLQPEEVRQQTGAAESDLDMSIDDLDFSAKYTKVIPSSEIADILGLKPREKALEKRYVTRRKDTGLLAQESVDYVPLELISSNPKLLDAKNEPWPGGGMHQLYTVGIEIAEAIDIVTSSMPTPDEVENWGLESGVPMLRTRCMSRDTNGRIVSVSDASYPADRTELVFHTKLKPWGSQTAKGN